MKSVKRIFILSFIVLSFWPFAEFFLNQYQNAAALDISGSNNEYSVHIEDAPDGIDVYVTTPTGASNLQTFFIQYFNPSSSGQNILVQEPLTNFFIGFPSKIYFIMTNASIINTPLFNNLYVIAIFLSRCIYIGIMLLFIYIIIYPICILLGSRR